MSSRSSLTANLVSAFFSDAFSLSLSPTPTPLANAIENEIKHKLVNTHVRLPAPLPVLQRKNNIPPADTVTGKSAAMTVASGPVWPASQPVTPPRIADDKTPKAAANTVGGGPARVPIAGDEPATMHYLSRARYRSAAVGTQMPIGNHGRGPSC